MEGYESIRTEKKALWDITPPPLLLLRVLGRHLYAYIIHIIYVKN